MSSFTSIPDYTEFQTLKLDWPNPSILRVTFNRPEKCNALDARGHSELVALWPQIDRDPRIRAVLLRGAGGHFCAGGDFTLIEETINDYDKLLRLWKEARDLVYVMLNCNKPMVSAIRGACAGAGLAAALLCDIAIASRTAKIVDGHTRLGVAAGDHAVLLWPFLCGMARAKYYLMLCEPLSGAEAERIGLIARAVEDDCVEDEAMKIAQRLADGAPNALHMTKFALNRALKTLEPAFDLSTALEMLGFAGAEIREGLAAHREKRSPDFSAQSPL